jgi:general secretion pathway protein D
MLKLGALALTLAIAAGCASGGGLSAGDEAIKRGDYDAAVAYYREALSHDPSKVEIRIYLSRAMQSASFEHLKRARQLESQEQWQGAAAEYRLAADLDPTATLALTRALELERKVRDLMEASRPKPRIDALNQQATAGSPIPRLDPRAPVMNINLSGSVKDILNFIGENTGITVTYDALGAIPILNNPYTISMQNAPLEAVLNQMLTANTLTYKITDSKTIFVYQDTPGNRTKYEDQYVQTFYISNAELNDLQQILNQVLVSQGSTGSRPSIFPNKSANTLVVKATAPVMAIIDSLIKSNDKPRAEVVVDVEILEVDRTRTRQLGLDLSQYALGFTYSPESSPPNTATNPGAFPAQPPPINMNTIVNGGVRTADFYMTAPSAMIHLLESDDKTRVLAKPQLRGREGTNLTLNLGQDIPIATTTFQPIATGGVANSPATSISYRTIGVILSMTPHVTYQDEIVLENLSVENSAVGGLVQAGGQPTLSFIDRRAVVTMRLRDGESNLLAGLLSDADRKTYTSLPGLSGVPILRLLFGNENNEHKQTDIVMIVTPHIVRSHDLTVADLKPLYIGTAANVGATTQPTLISPDIPIRTTSGPPPAAGAAQPPPAPTVTGNAPPVTAAPPPPNPRIVAVEPVTDPNAAKAPPPAAIILTAPQTPLQVGGAAYTTTLSATQVSQLGTVTVTLTYDPKMLKAVSTAEGNFMKQGSVQTVYQPKIDPLLGRVDITITRPGDAGASGTGLLASINFEAVGPGVSQIRLAAVAISADGKPIPITVAPVTVTVK